MKRKLKLSLLFFFMLVGFVALAKTPQAHKAKTVAPKIIIKTPKAVMADTASISGTKTTVCQGEASPRIIFKAKAVGLPCTFTYKIGTGSDLTISTANGKDTVGVAVPTTAAGTFTYTLLNARDKDNKSLDLNLTTTATITVNALPTVDFSFNNDNSCSGTEITFTPIISPAGLYTYSWDFGDAKNSTSMNPTHSYEMLGCNTKPYTVKLNVTNTSNCSSSVTKIIQVKEIPDIDFEDLDKIYEPSQSFSNCKDASLNKIYTIRVGNKSNSTCIASYSINWGDGQIQNNPTFPISHTYTEYGAYSLILKAIGTNGCENSKKYLVKNVSNPGGNIVPPASTMNNCAPDTLDFTIAGWGGNLTGTIYMIDYGDGTEPLVKRQEDMVLSQYYNSTNPKLSENFPVPHVYNTSACPNDYFIVNCTISNACVPSPRPSTVSNIIILTKPKANFTVPSSACVGTSVLFTNSTVVGYGSDCNPNAVFRWDFGDGTPIITTPFQAAANINHTYTKAGNYTVKLMAKNMCDSTIKTQAICVESPLTPQFTVSANTGCMPLTVSTTNTTDISKVCQPVNYQWTVTYTSSNCGASSDYSFTNGTLSSANPTFTFKNSGTYTIKLTMPNACGSPFAQQVITVTKPPTASINNIADICGSGTISPSANVTNCSNSVIPMTYSWSFPGGTPASSTSLVPGSISYSAPGNYTVSLTATNDCGTSAVVTKSFAVNEVPSLSNTSLTQTICSGFPIDSVPLTSTTTGAVFEWTATATTGITGFKSKGVGTIPIQTLLNSTANVGIVTYSITPKKGSCFGSLVNYVVTVNPAPTITTQPQSFSVCKDGTAKTLSVVVSSNSGSPNYQWFSNNSNSNIGGTLITGKTDASFTPPTSTVDTIYYYCAISFGSGGCSLIKSNVAVVQVTEIPAITIQPKSTQKICVGGTIQALEVIYSGGSGSPSYQWYSNITKSNLNGTVINGAKASTYTPPTFNSADTCYFYVVISFGANGCGDVTSTPAEVIVLPDPTLTTQPLLTQTICRGTTPNDLKVVAAGGEGTFSYQWYSNVSNSIIGGNKITGATADVYTPPTTLEGTTYYFCEVKQTGLGCSVTSTPSKVEVVIAPTVSPQPISNSLCQNGSTPKLTVGYINGTGIASYQWYSNATNSNTSGHAITGATNSDYQPITTAIDTTYYYCEINLSGGGCSRLTSLPAAIAVNAVPKISTQPVDSQAICVDGTIPSLRVATLGGAGNVSYQWYRNSSKSNSGGQAIAGALFNNYAPPAFNVAGKYYYYVEINFSEGSCGQLTSNVAEVVVLPDPIVVNQPIASQTICQNTASAALIVTAGGGIGKFSYQWYRNDNKANFGGMLIPSATDSSYIPPSALEGVKYYYCEISQVNGSDCKVTSQASELKINKAAIITKQPQSQVICKDDVPADLTVGYQYGAGAPAYQWYRNATKALGGQAILNATTSNYIPETTETGTNYYYCIITLPIGGCSELTSDIVSVTVNPYAVIKNTTALICSGNSFSVSPTNNGTDLVPIGTSYTWLAPVVVPANAILGATEQKMAQTNISQTLTNLTTNPATVTYAVASLAGGCPGIPFKIIVTVNPSVNAIISKTNSSCFNANNGELHATISGGIPFAASNPYQISWTSSNGFSSTQADNVGLAPGVYNLSIQDAGGCPYSRTDTIYEPADLIIYTDTFKNASCNNAANGKIAVSITGGTAPYRFAWEKDHSPFSNKQNLSNLSPGEYQLTVTDNNGCIPKTAQFIITEPTPLTVKRISKKDNICFGDSLGSITVSASGGTPFGNSPSNPYVFQWTGPNGFVSNSQNLNRLPVGIYNLTVTDLNGCAVQLSETITQPTEIKIEAATTPITCYGANNASLNVTLSGGNPPYTTEWSNLANGLFQNNLSAGDYIITVVDASQCQKVAHIIIPEAPIFTIKPVVKNVSCYGAKDGNITLNLTGGTKPIKLLWDDNAVVGNIRNNLGPGTYVVHISDGVPCSITDTFTITEPDELLVSAKITNAFDCNDARSGAIKLTVSGGVPPYKYNWTNGAKTDSLSRITAGTYTVTITDSLGFTRCAQYKVARHQPLDIRIDSVINFNCTTKVIKAVSTAHITGGVQPYKLTWSTGKISGENNEIMETEQNGIVILDVTDALGCAASTTFNTNIPQVGIDYKLLDCNNNIVQFRALVPNESSNSYSYLWDFGDGQTADTKAPTHTFAKAGSYKVMLTFTANSCQAVYETTVVVGQLPIITISPLPKLCKNDSVTVWAKGADSYYWNNGSTADSLVIKHDGEYSVTGTLKSGCTDTYRFTASYYDTFNYTILSDKDEVGIESQSEPLHLWSDDIPSSVYYWDFGDGTTDYGRDLYHKFNVLKDGYFDVKLQVTNPYGCTETFTKRIWQNASTTTNTFSPNGDGKNDVFLQGWHIQVFNRNGVMIYDGVDGWDGTHNGKQVSNDTYFYVQYYSAGSGSKSTTGFVTVIR